MSVIILPFSGKVNYFLEISNFRDDTKNNLYEILKGLMQKTGLLTELIQLNIITNFKLFFPAKFLIKLLVLFI